MNPNHTARTRVPAALAALTAIVLAGCGTSRHTSAPVLSTRLSDVVAKARADHRLPALAAASFGLDSIEVAADGVRRLGTAAAVSTSDLFHVGSLTKGMLATAIGRLVEDGTLSWSLTLAEAFPELGASMDTAYARVTLAQLLRNRGGVPGFNDLEDFAEMPAFAGDATAQRLEFACWVLRRAPAVAPGDYLYSSGGFAIAAAIAERRSGVTWDALVRRRVLAPAGASMFVGWPLEAGAAEPCGHMLVGPNLVPIDPSMGHIPAVIAPAGDVSMTVRDFARYAQLHLRALCGRPGLLAPDTWTRLHTPDGDYAMGWQVVGTAGARALMHDGSPATFFAFVVLYEKQQRGFVIVTNAVTPQVQDAIADVLVGMAPSANASQMLAPVTALRAAVAR